MPNDIWSVLGPFLGAGVGYYVRIVVSRNAADRKEDRDLIDKIIADIENVESLAYEFYTLPPDDAKANNLHLQINRLLKQVGRETNILSIRYGDKAISKFQLNLKQTITLNDFESKDRLARNHDDPLLDDISDCSRRLIGELELAFLKKYRKNCQK